MQQAGITIEAKTREELQSKMVSALKDFMKQFWPEEKRIITYRIYSTWNGFACQKIEQLADNLFCLSKARYFKTKEQAEKYKEKKLSLQKQEIEK